QHGGGAIDNAGTSLVLLDCVFAGNTSASGTGPDIWHEGSGTLAAAYCLVSDGTTAGIANGLNNNIVGSAGSPINAVLPQLGNYGGTTQTVPHLAGSRALAAGPSPLTNFITLDQRGFPRLSRVSVDIGAVEVSSNSFVTTVADNGSGSLRNAVTSVPAGDLI